MLALGFFLGSAKQNTGASTSTPVVVSPTITEATSATSLSNWKTFDSEKFGYSIKYPANYFQNICNNETLDLNKKTTNDCGSDRIPFIRAISLDSQKIIFQEFIEQLKDTYQVTDSEKNINGQDYTFYYGKIKSGVRGIAGESGFWVRLADNLVLQISLSSYSNEDLMYFDEILSTFKFL